MPSSLLPSVIGNVVANRQRLSQIRQRVGLEPSPQSLRELAPSPPQGPAQRPGAAQQAMTQEPDFDGFQIPADKQTAMLQQAGQFIEQFGAKQQEMIDREKQPRGLQKAGGGAQMPAPTQRITDQRIVRGLAPMAEFFRANGRLPSPDELRQLSITRMLTQQLGRAPTPTEIQLYLTKPPKGTQ